LTKAGIALGNASYGDSTVNRILLDDGSLNASGYYWAVIVSGESISHESPSPDKLCFGNIYGA
jgi:hypothetical protein